MNLIFGVHYFASLAFIPYCILLQFQPFHMFGYKS